MSTTDYAATIYSRPGCMKCRATEIQLRKLGIEPAVKQIDDHPDKMDLMAANGWMALPLVEVEVSGEETMRWADMDINKITSLGYLVNSDA